VGSRTTEARRCGNEAFIHDGQLQEVLGDSTGLQIIIVGLANASEETQRTRPAEVIVENVQHESFRLQDLVHSIASIDHVVDLRDGGSLYLFILGGNVNSSSTDQLQFSE
jgi:hypothetical protein